MASSVSEVAASGPFVSEVLRCRLYVAEGIEALQEVNTSALDTFDTERLSLATHATALCLRSIRHRLVFDIMAADDPVKLLGLRASSSLITAALQLNSSPVELRAVQPWDRLGIYMFPTLLSFKDWVAKTDQVASALGGDDPTEYGAFVAEAEVEFKKFTANYACFTKVYVKLLLNKQKRRVEAEFFQTSTLLSGRPADDSV
ncbi:hypothetical protein OC846_006449 [Tilletia horrida]|uniref:Uncharacterized protein n=1 Tax=Tilletia horrida TaxID=155126 RepID=A0AAN6JNN2_9BASI|nr:hypothetical protein OC845_006432 [Tilletia horrida]KAK0543335.1 hypothetical protein OC846_006449 [Tilletia horrida]